MCILWYLAVPNKTDSWDHTYLTLSSYAVSHQFHPKLCGAPTSKDHLFMLWTTRDRCTDIIQGLLIMGFAFIKTEMMS